MSRARLMTRALSTAALAVGLTGGTVAAGAAAIPATASATAPATLPASSRTAAAEPDPEATPLSVVLSSLSPATIPRKGAITLTGVVANNSGEEWSDINVAPFLSSRPITTRDELAQAVETVPSATVGGRLADDSTYVSVGDLANGQSAPFTIRVPRSSLGISGDPGVYWIGVHALGANADGRDLEADGRARTFIPLVPRATERSRSVPVSVVLPLRERARRAADGSLNGPTRWDGLTGPNGRLTRLAAFGATAGGQSLTWLVDPAVLDALEDFGLGNPPVSLGSARRSDAGKDQPSASPSPSVAPTPLSEAPSETEQTRATSVLETFLGSVRSQDVLTLGYSDPDAASLARNRASLLRRSEGLAARRMKARDLTAVPAIAPPNGLFDPSLLPQVDQDSVLLLSDRGRLSSAPSSRLASGQELLLSDERASTGGPAPTAALDPLALRQRILAEAALEAEKGRAATRPIVVQLPPRWNPGPRWREADFFGGLQQPWLRMAPVPRNPSTTYAGQLSYGSAAVAREVRASNVSATRMLAHTSTVLGHLLANDNDVTDRLTGAALQASAYSARATQALATDQVLALDTTTRDLMDQVQVIGTDFVTLSGGSGTLTVTIVNGLEQPITVGLHARADSPDVKVATPDPVEMQAGQRTTLRLDTTSRSGVHDVTIFPVTSQGEQLGTPLTFSLRTSQVGRLIWYIIIAGGVLLAVMIVRRIVLRIRLHRWRVSEET